MLFFAYIRYRFLPLIFHLSYKLIPATSDWTSKTQHNRKCRKYRKSKKKKAKNNFHQKTISTTQVHLQKKLSKAQSQ